MGYIKSVYNNWFFLDGNDFYSGRKINISLNDDKINKEIIIDENRKKYSNKEFGISIIEIKSKDGIKKDSFLDIDEHIYDENPKEYLKKLPIYLLHYPNGDKIKKSEGRIISEKKILLSIRVVAILAHLVDL